MRRLLPALVLLASSCASSPVRQCIDLSGTYQIRGACIHEGSGAKSFFFGDAVAVANVASIAIEQRGCNLKLEVTSADGTKTSSILDHDLEWEGDSVSFGWMPRRGSGPIAGASRTSRRVTLTLEDQTLHVISAVDEVGVALVFLPFHSHGEASCTLQRASL